MPNTYSRIVPVFGLLLAFSLIVGAASAQVSDQPRPQQPGAQAPDQPRPTPGAPAQPAPGAPARPSPGGEAQAKPQAAQIARGELTNIDAVAKMLTIKPAEGAEQKFQYNDETKVTGARGGVSGLATQSGKQVVVHFNSQGANRVATEIEIQDKPAAPGAADRPAPGAGDRPSAPGAPGAGDRPGAGDKPGAGER
jgi:translation initiation factor IF-2